MASRSSARLTVLAAATFLAFASVSGAQPLSATLTIEAIDVPNRLLTLKEDTGSVEVFAVGPAVKGFSDLKVGGRVAIRYFEPLLSAVRPAGTPAPVTGGQPAPASPTDVSATVVVSAIDPKVPSLSVKTDDGQALVFKVGDKKVIETLKAGDKVDITYTRAFAIQVDKK